jgi:hypothetical protein
MADLIYPDINGRRMSFASIEARFSDQKIIGFRSINYDAGLEIGKVYGSASQKLGRTAGKEDSTGSFDMYLEEWQRLIKKLGDGFGKKAFTLVVQFAELGFGADVITHTLRGVRILKPGAAHGEGTEALMVGNEIDIMQIDYGGEGGNALTLAGVLDTRNLGGL